MKPISICTFTLFLFLIISPGKATEEIAEQTGKSCAHCHLDPSGGGELTKAGKDYLLEQSKSNEGNQKKASQPADRDFLHIVRLLAGYLHILIAIFWFGTILYVHIVLKPSYAAHGLPKGEVRLGLISMAVMAVTGTILSYFRVPTLSFLFETRFGILLTIKIFLFLIMSASALYVVFFLGPKLRKKKEKHLEQKGDLTSEDLMLFDGKEGQAVYFAYKGKIVDVTESELWEKGTHFGKHHAGVDLTDMLRQAPHGEEKIQEMPEIGKLIFTKLKSVHSRHEKSFYIIAYLNLVLVFLIALILAFWRWW